MDYCMSVNVTLKKRKWYAMTRHSIIYDAGLKPGEAQAGYTCDIEN
jgi:hypothetical protein